jgi:hypothetical protein
MTLVNCKISNYPLGEPDNQNPSNVMAFGNSVNNNTLPSHVKLVIKPNNNNEDPNGFYAVRAADFHIGGRENFLNLESIIPTTEFFALNGANYDSPWYGTPPWYVYDTYPPEFGGATFGTIYEPSASQSNIGVVLGGLNVDWNDLSDSMYGLGYSPVTVQRNQLSIDIFGNINNTGVGRIYHYSGFNSTLDTVQQLLEYPSASSDGVWGSTGQIYPPFSSSDPIYYVAEGCADNVCYATAKWWRLWVGDTISPSASLPPTSSDIQYNKGYEKTTSWTHINRIMICDSMSGLGAELDDPDNYPIDNEVCVWVEFKDSYALDALPENNPELWDIKVDIDGAAKFIEY